MALDGFSALLCSLYSLKQKYSTSILAEIKATFYNAFCLLILNISFSMTLHNAIENKF